MKDVPQVRKQLDIRIAAIHDPTSAVSADDNKADIGSNGR